MTVIDLAGDLAQAQLAARLPHPLIDQLLGAATAVGNRNTNIPTARQVIWRGLKRIRIDGLLPSPVREIEALGRDIGAEVAIGFLCDGSATVTAAMLDECRRREAAEKAGQSSVAKAGELGAGRPDLLHEVGVNSLG